MEQEKPTEDNMDKKIEEKTEEKKVVVETPKQHTPSKKDAGQDGEVKVESKGDLETQKAETKRKKMQSMRERKRKLKLKKRQRKKRKL